MNWVGNILIIVFLAGGALAASTAYHVSVDLPDSYFPKDSQALTLKSKTGALVLEDVEKLELARRKFLLPSNVIPTPDGSLASQNALMRGLLLVVEEKEVKSRAISRMNPKDLMVAKLDEETGRVYLLNGESVPIAMPKDKLTADLRTVLREQTKNKDKKIRQGFVIVQEFSFERWPGLWWFVLSVVGLLGGVLLVRMSAKRQLTTAKEGQPGEGPEEAIQGMKANLQTLLQELGEKTSGLEDWRKRLPGTDHANLDTFMEARLQLIQRLGNEEVQRLESSDAEKDEAFLQSVQTKLQPDEQSRVSEFLEARMALTESFAEADWQQFQKEMLLPPGKKDFRLLLILERLSELQRTHLNAFVEARTPLIARFGLGKFAEIMDRFAACERQINRAWSAAADGVFDESLESLHNANELADEVLLRMK